MSRAVIKLPKAETDLIGCYAYLCENASIKTADRFVAAAEKTLALLAKSPGIGTPHKTKRRELTGLRSFPVSNFKKYFLFYHTFDDRIELVRIVHGARDIKKMLDV